MPEVQTYPKALRAIAWIAAAVLVVSVAAIGLQYASISNTYFYCLGGSPYSEEKTSVTWAISWLPFGLDCIYYERGASTEAVHRFSELGTAWVVTALASLVILLGAVFALVNRTKPRG